MLKEIPRLLARLTNRGDEQRLALLEQSLAKDQVRIGQLMIVSAPALRGSIPISEVTRAKDELKTSIEQKRWLFAQFAKRYIPGETPKTSILRTVFIEGNLISLVGGDSFRKLAGELGLSWRECLNLFKEACETFVFNGTIEAISGSSLPPTSLE